MGNSRDLNHDPVQPIVLDEPDHWQLAFGPNGRGVPARILAALIVFLLAVLAEMWYRTQALHEALHSEIRSSSLLLAVFLISWLAALGLLGGRLINRLRFFATLESVEEMSDRLGASQEELETEIRGGDIQPRYIVNGRKLYDRKDLGDAATLLRVSASSAGSLSLLKPVVAAQGEAENLIRPA